LANAGCVNPSNAPDIPLSIDEVSTTAIKDGLIRIILFNTEVEPKMYLEFIEVPGRKLLQRKVIKSITLNGDVLDFESSGSVFIENINVDDNQVDFEVIYEHEGRRGEISAQCRVKLAKSKLTELICTRVKEND
jgi:hypothetical protein